VGLGSPTADAMQSQQRTWHSCFQCHYSHIDQDRCQELSEEEGRIFKQCQQHFGFGMLDVGQYAAQLAWWLNFFPPERFLVVSSLELRDDASRLKVR
jgi:hypothetical protein